VWFSDSGAEEKMIDYLEGLADEGRLFKEPGEDATSFLDLGTGNGHLLYSLRDNGWSGRMLGLDYSSTSVNLARQIGENRLSSTTDRSEEASENADGTEAEDQEDANAGSRLPVHFEEYDIFNPVPLPTSPPDGFDVVLDKGTFDAISLSSDIDSSGRRLCEAYCSYIKPLIQPNGFFIITSCNWTEDELRAWFDKANGEEEGKLTFYDRVKYPRFTFGGKTGQSVVTLCFRNGDVD
jgi:SAM-dependent methyltransferase